MSPSWNAFHSTSRIMENFDGPSVASKSSGQSISADFVSLEDRLEKQNLLIQTLLMILLEKKVIHEDEFKEWMIYVDELDGKRDGKLRENKSPVICPKCKRNNPPNRTACQYCGIEFPPEFLQYKNKES